jgi:hypothetical protein
MKILQSKILIIIVLFGTTVYAGPSGPPPPGVPPPGLPIDGTVGLLFGAALLYGMYKIYKLRLNKKTPM